MKAMNPVVLSADDAKRQIEYDPMTGLCHWKTATKSLPAGRVAGSKDVHGYMQIKIGGRVYKLHRVIWLLVYGRWPDGDVDHINGERCDNRLSNLRVVSNAINCQNKRAPLPSNRSGYLGVTPYRNGKWKAHVMLNRRQYHLGYFDTPEEAHQAYLRAKRNLHIGCTI